MESGLRHVDVFQFLVCDFYAFGVDAFIEYAPNLQPLFRGCGSYEVHDNFMADQRPPSPVLGDERKQPVLYLVPLARARREVAYAYGKACFLRKLLQLQLPQPQSGTVAPAAIGGN